MVESNLTIGDYVLATKYRDGDPCDHFCVGFYSGILGDRYLVVDENKNQFRTNGFRRCERISKRVGEVLVKCMPTIGDKPGPSIWYWRYHPDRLMEMCGGR